MTAQNGVNTALTLPGRVFPRPFTHGGGGTSAGGQSVNGGLIRADIHFMGGDLTLIDYIIN